MSEREPLFVVVAHQDDWQLFMGKDVFGHLRDVRKRVVFIVTTAGDAGDAESHWKSRASGAVLSALRALPSWSPYRLRAMESPTLPSGYAVSYAQTEANGNAVLTCAVDDRDAAEIRMHLLHLPDGGTHGNGFAPRFESLSALRNEGKALHTLWPEETPAVYGTWEELESTIEAVMLVERSAFPGPIRVLAVDPDERENPGDHVDHRLTSQAVASILRRHSCFVPVWFATYCIAQRDENLDADDANDQRAAIHAYAGGYMATAAGLQPTWRRGWEREYPAFRNRQYSNDRTEERT